MEVGEGLGARRSLGAHMGFAVDCDVEAIPRKAARDSAPRSGEVYQNRGWWDDRAVLLGGGQPAASEAKRSSTVVAPPSGWIVTT